MIAGTFLALVFLVIAVALALLYFVLRHSEIQAELREHEEGE